MPKCVSKISFIQRVSCIWCCTNPVKAQSILGANREAAIPENSRESLDSMDNNTNKRVVNSTDQWTDRRLVFIQPNLLAGFNQFKACFVDRA